MKEIVKYGVAIKGTNKPLGFTYVTGGDDLCTEIEFRFDDQEENVWLVDREETAQKARDTNPQWYNAYYDTPLHIKGEELEVVKITLKVEKVD